MQLYINKPGSSLRIRNGQLLIRHELREEQIPIGKVRSIFLTRSAHLTAEVAFTAAELDIDIVFTDRNGQPVARLWSNRFGSIATIRKQQLAFSQSGESAPWVRELLAEKIQGQIALLLLLIRIDKSNEAEIMTAVNRIEGYRSRILGLGGATLGEITGELRALEANASRAYWRSISAALPQQYAFEGRSRRPATDMFNALLNYAYGILNNQVESALIRAGIDPFIGIFHRDEHQRPVLVYDVMERFRPWADFVVTSLCRQEVIFVEFFEVEAGGFWLSEQGKRILVQTYHDYFEEITHYQGLDRSRRTHIDLYAQMLATHFKTFRENH